MVSISGIRGVVGVSLTPAEIVKYSAAFAEYCHRGRIIIGRDGRSGGAIVGNLVSSTLLAMGCDVTALGIVPTPTVQIAVEKLRAAGGISITASHNPMEWNGLKFIAPTGLFLNAEENRRFWTIADNGSPKYSVWDKVGKHTPDDSFIDMHIDLVLSLPYINAEQIRKRKFKVVLDCINAAGGAIVPKLLERLGVDFVPLNCELSGVFARKPEPVPENLQQVCAAVVREKADFGIVVDPDVDRLVLITDKGEPFGEEYTITTAINLILSKRKAPNTVVVNLSTTRAVEDIAMRYSANVVRTPVGEINVATKMESIGAIVGGEGSGGVILPEVHLGRDAIVGIGLILQQLAEFNGTVTEFKASLPQYTIVKEKVELTDSSPDAALQSIADDRSNGGEVNTEDGVRIAFADSWVHLRKSNTEPIIRIIAEAPTFTAATNLAQNYKNRIASVGNRK
ncbi:MAG TPA: phosphoglucosamine mutase [Bacteroidota bacterium]|nr:phosphoglucosamine mutase [Bacteroidota bacterium]